MKKECNTTKSAKSKPNVAVVGTMEKGQSWDDFKAKLMASLIRQGIIKDDEEPIKPSGR